MNAFEVIERKAHVLLDFDGPICGVFEGVGGRVVAGRLCEFLARLGVVVRPHVAESGDPFEVLFFAAGVHGDVGRAVHGELARAEVEAVASAPETPGVADVVRYLVQRGRTVSVVSNNSGDAVWAYLRTVDFGECVTGVSARSADNLGLLKPEPFLVGEAVRRLGAIAADCVMVGDSVSDVEAAKAAGVGVIGFANKPRKRERFEALDVDAVITDMSELIGSVSPAG